MVEVKHSGKSMDQRVADRLRNSGDAAHADHHNVHGTGPTRAHTNIHNTRNQSWGEDHPGEGDIFNRPRGPANPHGEIK
jgi:hypothetical protein